MVLALVRLKKTRLARVSNWPERSIAVIVLSKVAGSALSAIAWISLRCSAMPRSKAGAKWLSLILSNCGNCNGSGLFSNSGLSLAASAGMAALSVAVGAEGLSLSQPTRAVADRASARAQASGRFIEVVLGGYVRCGIACDRVADPASGSP